MKKRISLLVVVSMISVNVGAQIPTVGDIRSSIGGNEFFVGRSEGKPLIRVNIVSGVRTPGIYHVPVDSTLPDVLSYAGGSVEGAELDKIRVRSTSPDLPKKLILYDFYDLAQRQSSFPVLLDGDLVQIDTHPDRLSRAAVIVGILGTVTSVILAGLVYQRTQ